MPKTTNPLTERHGVSTNVILTVVVVVVAVVVIGGVLLFSGSRDGQPGGGEPVPAQVLRHPDSNTLLNTPRSGVTVVEFLDYQCPVCAKYYQDVTSKVEQRYPGRINFVTRNYPISEMHPLALPAAKAAEAAGMQGKYKEMYHALYQNWSSWAMNGQKSSDDKQRANQRFEQYAQKIGLDMAKFQQDRDSGAVQRRIDRDMADGERAGVRGTPTLFVNGKEFEPTSNDYDEVARQLTEQIDGALQK